MKPVVRVTQIESFRRYIEQSEYDNYEITEQSVIDGITGAFLGNEFSRIGTAFHSIVETGRPECGKAPAAVRKFMLYGREKTEPLPEGRTFNIDGHPVTLDTAQCRVALDYRGGYPAAFHEVREYKDYGPAIVTGKADMTDGMEIRDIKTKFSAVRDSDYTSSAQWKFYLDLFQADTFHFDLFVFQGYNKERHGTDVRGLPLSRREPPITCRRYNRLADDINYLLREFIAWAELRNLTQYLHFKE